MYECPSGSDIYLKIRGIDDGDQCLTGFKLPGETAYKYGSLVDLDKLLNIPYGGSDKYWMKFGGFGIGEDMPFEGCIDDNNQEHVRLLSFSWPSYFSLGILKFSGIQVNRTFSQVFEIHFNCRFLIGMAVVLGAPPFGSKS